LKNIHGTSKKNTSDVIEIIKFKNKPFKTTSTFRCYLIFKYPALLNPASVDDLCR